ncbi:MAG: carboxypeptidase regulatory-like domain-containing protein [Acidobacteriota bacterium]
MKRNLLILSISIILALLAVRLQTAESKTGPARNDVAETASAPEFRKAAAFATSAEVRSFYRQHTVHGKFSLRSSVVTIPDPVTHAYSVSHDPDSAMARASAIPMPTPDMSFDGLSNFDNIAEYNAVIVPPDITGDVGPDNFVQAVNALVRVYDKQGNAVTQPFRMSQLFAPLATPCSTRDDGDPVVLYDPLAGRWILSQYCNNFPPFRQMMAVSKTADPAGAYFVYEFVMPNVKINDFPKFGVWPDAYYMSDEEFLGSDYAGAGLFAFDRTKMLVGDPSAGYVYIDRPSNSTERRSNFVPADLDGIHPPPSGAPNVFVSYSATEYGDAQDAIRLFDFHADFANPLNSTVVERPESPLSVAAFDPTSPSGRADIAQPAPGERLDSNSDRINYRVAYRNLGGSESLVFNQTVRLTQDPDPYRAGVRLYEFRRKHGAPFVATEQSTIGDNTSSRWIGSAAEDHQGNLAVSYNFVNDEKVPSFLYTGRTATEPAGTFRSEATLINGTGVQKAFGWRWGDYAVLTVDPVDDCTFWAAGEYYTLASQNVSDFTWLTRIGSFKFAECTAAPRSFISGVVTDASTGLPIADALVASTVFSRSTSSAGSYGGLMLLPGSYALTASARGYRPQTINATLDDGQRLTQDFALQPVAVIENSGVLLTAESCLPNRSPEPGEAVTYDITLRNTGMTATHELTATLIAGGGVTVPSAVQNYGSLAPHGASATRAFSFTVDPALPCGSALTLTLQLKDDDSDLGTITISLQTGEPRIAFHEGFDRVPQGFLPPRWTRSAADINGLPDYPRNWKASTKRSVSGSRSAFSPDLNQVGINEMVSPVFVVTTPQARLTFNNWYDLETTFLRNRLYDGSVLEIKLGNADWQDIIAAGGQFESGGYDGLIDACCSNPLAGHAGWSGRSGPDQTSEFITTSVRLPAAAAGQTVQLRWRIGTDVGTFREGQYIDDVTVTDGYFCGCSLSRQ